jgi:AP-3 complex subunit delta-1
VQKKKRPEEQVDSEDIESIPIVKLDLNGLTPDKPKKAERPRTPTPPPVFVDIEGELPPARVSTPRRDKAPTPVPAEVSEKEEPAVANHPAAVQVVKKKKSKRPK